jgi:hypothetical protein
MWDISVVTDMDGTACTPEYVGQTEGWTEQTHWNSLVTMFFNRKIFPLAYFDPLTNGIPTRRPIV